MAKRRQEHTPLASRLAIAFSMRMWPAWPRTPVFQQGAAAARDEPSLGRLARWPPALTEALQLSTHRQYIAASCSKLMLEECRRGLNTVRPQSAHGGLTPTKLAHLIPAAMEPETQRLYC